MTWQRFRLTALWCWHQLLTLGLAALVVVAAMVALSRELLPLADDYRPRLEAALAQRLGMPVTLQRLEGEADGLQLFLRLVRLDLHDPAAPGTVLLRVPEVEIRPKVWSSLLHRELRVDVRLHGLDIHLDQQADGRFQLRELARLARRDDAAARRTLGFVLRQPVLAVSGSRIALDFHDLPDLTLRGVELVNRNEGEHHRLAGRLRLPGVAEELVLQVDLDGDPLRWRETRARAWLRLPVLTLDDWLAPLAPALERHGFRIAHLRGGGQYWLELDRGRLVAARADVDWRDLRLLRNGAPRHLQDLRGQLAWSRNTAGWQIGAEGLRGRVDGHAWPLPTVALRSGPGLLSVAARNTNVAGVLRLFAGVPMAPALAEWLAAAAPAGQVAALRADLAAGASRQEGVGEDASGGAADGWRLRRLDLEGHGLSVATVGPRPGVSGLAGWLRWTPDRAWAGVSLQQGTLAIPTFQRDPLPVIRLDGRFRLARDGDAWRIDSDTLRAANADLGASAVLSLLLPPAPASPRLSLHAVAERARVSSAWRYVPLASAGEGTIAWLRDHLQGGTVTRGDVLFDGPLRADPELDPARLLLRFRTQGVALDYAPGWPALRDLDADVLIDGHRLAIRGHQARLLDGTVASAIGAEIPDLRAPVLGVSGQLASTGADVGRLFRDSPLATLVPGLTDVIALEGPLEAGLMLSLPLRGGAPDVNVVARLADNRLYVKPARLTASRLGGELRYSTRDGLQSPRLDAELLEAPVRVDIQGSGRPHNVTVNLEGQVGVPALRRWLGASLLEMTSGQTSYQARLTLPAGGRPRLQVDSSLSGLRVALPAPLGKTAEEVLPLRYQVGLGEGEQMGRLQYGQRLAGGLVWEGSRLDRALLRVGSTTAAWPQRSGLEIEGRVARLDVAEWRPVVARLQRGQSGQTVTARGESAMPELSRLDIEAAELLVEGSRLRDARISLQRQASAWQLALGSAEVDASARLPDAPGSEVQIGFRRLQWPLPAAPGRAVAGAGMTPVTGLGNRPLAIEGEGLRLGAWPGLGALAVKARVQPLPVGLRVDNIVLRGPVLDFRGQLDWQWRGGARTRVRGEAGSSNVSGLLAAFGVTSPLVSRKAGAALDLAWPGAPDRAAFGQLDGSLRIALEQGRLLNVSTGTSASRVFGWFTLDSLWRRIKGDFADVTRRGLAFDSLSLEGPLEAGVIQPATVRLQGPTLQAQGTGRIDLGRQKVDQHYAVTLPVTSAVPIAAVVVAGPVVGGAVAAAKMAFDKQIDKVTSLHYRVSGDWTDPRVDRLAGDLPPAPAPRPSGAVNVATQEDR